MSNLLTYLKILIFKIAYFPYLLIRKAIDFYKIRKAHGIPLHDRYGMTCFCGLAR